MACGDGSLSNRLGSSWIMRHYIGGAAVDERFGPGAERRRGKWPPNWWISGKRLARLQPATETQIDKPTQLPAGNRTRIVMKWNVCSMTDNTAIG